MITIQQITMENPHYEIERELRNEVLLRPIGLEDGAWEMHDKAALHFVALEASQVIGCVLLRMLGQGRAHLLQMAVKDSEQGKGIGKKLVMALVDYGRANGCKEMICHARATAASFYESLGFTIYGEPFQEVGMMHYHMRIEL